MQSLVPKSGGEIVVTEQLSFAVYMVVARR